MNNFFKSSEDSNFFKTNGYVILKTKQLDKIKKLKKYIETLDIDLKENFYYSLLRNSASENFDIKEKISQILQPVYDEFFENYTNRNESFLIKPPHHYNEMHLHQDWSFTDVLKFDIGTLWIPLSNVNESNGTFFMLPKSHRFFKNYISSNLDTSRIPSEDVKDNIVLNLEFGEMLVFNPSVFHGSTPNNSSEPRIVTTTHLFPKEAPYCYFYKENETQVVQYDLDENELLKNLNTLVGNDVSHLKESSKFDYQHKYYEAEDLNTLSQKNKV